MHRTKTPEGPLLLRRSKKIKKRLGIGSLILASLFFFNPDAAIVDVLPDFFGYIILLLGLSQLRDLNDYLDTAYRKFSLMALLSLAKTLSFLLASGFVTSAEMPDTLLLLAFIFAVVDFLVLIPAWIAFFEGLSYLTTQVGCDLLMTMQKTGKAEKSRFDRMRILTVLFVVIKSVFAVLPEFSALSKDVAVQTVVLYDYIGLLRMAAILPVLILGIVWLISFTSFVRALLKEREFLSRIAEKYRTEILPKDSIFIQRHIRLAFFIFYFALVFHLDFRLAGIGENALGGDLGTVNILPDAIFGIILAIAVLFMGRHVTGWRPVLLATLPFAVISVISNYTEYTFFHTYNIVSVQRNEEAYAEFCTVVLWKVCEQLLFLFLIISFLLMLRHLVSSYTGFSVSTAETQNRDEKIKAIHRALYADIWIVLGASILTAVSKTMKVALSYYQLAGGQLDWFSIVDTAFALLFCVVFVRALRNIYAQVEHKFMLT